MKNSHLELILMLAVLLSSCGEKHSKVESDKKIRNSINKYFGSKNKYIYAKNIDFDQPTIVDLIATAGEEYSVASFDVYWVGKTQNAKKIRIIIADKATGEFRLEHFEKGAVDDPVAEEYTGHAMFLMPKDFWKKMKGEDLAFRLIDGKGYVYGKPFLTKKPEPSRYGVFNFSREKL